MEIKKIQIWNFFKKRIWNCTKILCLTFALKGCVRTKQNFAFGATSICWVFSFPNLLSNLTSEFWRKCLIQVLLNLTIPKSVSRISILRHDPFLCPCHVKNLVCRPKVDQVQSDPKGLLAGQVNLEKWKRIVSFCIDVKNRLTWAKIQKPTWNTSKLCHNLRGRNIFLVLPTSKKSFNFVTK